MYTQLVAFNLILFIYRRAHTQSPQSHTHGRQAGCFHFFYSSYFGHGNNTYIGCVIYGNGAFLIYSALLINPNWDFCVVLFVVVVVF